MAIPISPNVNQLQNTGSCKKCDLENVSLGWADLFGAFLNDASNRGANLTDANLSSANLSGATLHGAEVSGASFSGATFCKTITSDGETNISGC